MTDMVRKSRPQVLAYWRFRPGLGEIILRTEPASSIKLAPALQRSNLVNLDRYDWLILRVLQEDGRISNQELADRIGLSPSPCLRRMRALEESGLITGYRALLDAKKLGLSLMALIYISMDQHTPERFTSFDAAIAGIPELLECLLITGQDADYQLKVVVKDMDAYQELLLNRLTRIPGVTGVHSSFVLRRVVDRTALPLAMPSNLLTR
jgi:Lrp/AsnC family leucine-responsive transcriptional regulator